MFLKTQLLLCSLFLFLLLVSGCNTHYGFEFRDVSTIQTAAPECFPLTIDCDLNVTRIGLQESQKRILRDYRHTVRMGKRYCFKKYCGYTDSERAILMPATMIAFPCLTWGTAMSIGKVPKNNQDNLAFLQKYYLDSLEDWGPMIGYGAVVSILLGTGDLLYYAGSTVWSFVAVPVYYIWNRTTSSGASWNYCSNAPGYFHKFMSLPFFNLFVPGYIPPYLNHGKMLHKDENYATPVNLDVQMAQEIPQIIKRPLVPGTVVTIEYEGRSYTGKTDMNGYMALPFKLYPLPARHSSLTIMVSQYKSKLQPKITDIKYVHTFSSERYLTIAQAQLYSTVKNSSFDYMKRFRAMYALKAVVCPQDFKRFEEDPAKFLAGIK